MDATLQARLERLRHYATRYEVVLIHRETLERRLLCYTPRRSKPGLFAYIRTQGAALVAFCGDERAFPVDYGLTEGAAQEIGLGRGPALRIGDWYLGFSGRTQREALIAGELVWFGDAR